MSYWIWIDNWNAQDNTDTALLLFKKTICLELSGKPVTIKISADSRYKLYINGRLCEIGPCKGDLKKWFYDEIDITSYLKTGDNDILVKVLHYPIDFNKGNLSVFRTETPGLYIESELQSLCTDEQWMVTRDRGFHIVSENPFFAPLQIYELVDTDSSEMVWSRAKAYRENETAKCLNIQNLAKRTIPFMYRTDRQFSAVSKIRDEVSESEQWNDFIHGEGSIRIASNTQICVELDAGELTCGYLYLTMRKGKQSKIELLQAECYAEYVPSPPRDYSDLPIKKNRADSKGTLCGNTDTYIVGGTEQESYEPFWFRTFRFLQIRITTADEPLELLNLHYAETGYPLEVRNVPQLSNPVKKNIWDISLRTLKRCMHETYEDCPFYEQLQYIMDSRSQILYTYAVAEDDRLARKCIDDLARSQYPDGLLNACYPSTTKNVIPGFSIYFIGMLYDHMKYKGDRAFVQEYLPTADRILSYFEANRNESGIVNKVGDLNKPGNYWSFIDWTPEWDATNGVPPATLNGPITMESLLYLLGLQYAVELADFAGEAEKASKYENAATAMASAIRNNCLGKKGMYTDGPGSETYSQHCQVFAVLTGLTDPVLGKKHLLETLHNKDEYSQCSVAMLYYLFRALEKCNAYEETQTLWKIFEDMLNNNLTTCAEDPLASRSDCHAWGALALSEFIVTRL